MLAENSFSMNSWADWQPILCMQFTQFWYRLDNHLSCDDRFSECVRLVLENECARIFECKKVILKMHISSFQTHTQCFNEAALGWAHIRTKLVAFTLFPPTPFAFYLTAAAGSLASSSGGGGSVLFNHFNWQPCEIPMQYRLLMSRRAHTNGAASHCAWEKRSGRTERTVSLASERMGQRATFTQIMRLLDLLGATRRTHETAQREISQWPKRNENNPSCAALCVRSVRWDGRKMDFPFNRTRALVWLHFGWVSGGARQY